MKAASSRPKLFVLCALTLAPSFALASDLILEKAPPLTVEQAPAYPENLARYHFGADVKASPLSNPIAKLQLSWNAQDRNVAEAALLCDDATTGYQLPAGQSTILVSLANIENIESISFQNDGAEGALTLSISNADVPANSPQWHSVANCALSEGVVATKVGPSEAKYVKLNFNVTKAGRIAAFGVYATPALSDFTMPRPRKVSFAETSSGFELINHNFTDLHAKARGLYASSGDRKTINNMIDDQPATAYQFAPNDNSPAAIIDLGRARELTRISAVYAPQPGSVDFYVLNTLPLGAPNDSTASDQSSIQKIANVQVADLPASLKIGEKEFTGLKPVGSVVTTNEGHASVDFAPVTGRYLMLKWHPASVRGEAFSVAQVAAFGVARHGTNAEESPSSETTSRRQMAGGKEFVGDKEILDNKQIPAEGPEAPAAGPAPNLPPVPPFTFIPQVPPAPVVPPVSP